MYKSQLLWEFKTGLEKDKIPPLLPNDAFELLENAYLYRKRIKRKQGAGFLGRLQRSFTSVSIGTSPASATFSFNLFTAFNTNNPTIIINETPPQAQINPGSVIITDGTDTFTDQGNGFLKRQDGDLTSTINYSTGAVTLNRTIDTAIPFTASFGYFPGLPVMGMPTQELVAINADRLIDFDMTYAYQYSNSLNAFQETPSIMVARWHGSNSNFFWAENAFSNNAGTGTLFVTNDTAAFQGYRVSNVTIVDATHFDVTTSGANIIQVGDFTYFDQMAAGTNPALFNGITGTVTIAGNPFTVLVPATAGFVYGGGPPNGVVIDQNRVIATSGDGIRWYDGVTWSNFQPPVNATNFLIGCLIIFYYRDRLVVFQPIETTQIGGLGANTFYQRGRWCQNGTPFYASNPIPSGLSSQSNAWRDDVPGKGGFVDAPTTERIISASLIKDNMIVRFERSTWRFRYTGNEELPFQWERINAEFGASSTFSGVNFDVGPIDVGSRGITQTDGISVLRIDNIIPDEVFEFENENAGPQRIWGIRDFDEQIVYWNFPNDVENGIFPNRILLYNYRDTSFAVLIDSYTAFGYWQSFNDLVWQDAKFSWESANFEWDSATNQALYSKVVGGNQQGYVMILQELASNQQSLRIENIIQGVNSAQIQSTNHNLSNTDYIKPQGILGAGAFLNGIVYAVVVIDANNYYLYQYNNLTLLFDSPVGGVTGTYLGAGEICRVDNFRIRTKKFNPNIQQGAATRLGYADFYIDVTEQGQFIVNYYVDDNDSTPVNQPPLNPGNDPLINPNSNVVETYLNAFETRGQNRVWHSLYDSCIGSFFQLEMTMSPTQINNLSIVNSDFVLHGINLWTESANERLS